MFTVRVLKREPKQFGHKGCIRVQLVKLRTLQPAGESEAEADMYRETVLPYDAGPATFKYACEFWKREADRLNSAFQPTFFGDKPWGRA